MTHFEEEGLPFMNLKWILQLLKPKMSYMLAKDWSKITIFHHILLKMPLLWSNIQMESPNFEWNAFKGIKITLNS